MAETLRFSDIFEAAEPVGSPPACPAGFGGGINTPNAAIASKGDGTGAEVFIECLRVREGMEAAAAFLETRRYAGLRNATTELE